MKKGLVAVTAVLVACAVSAPAGAAEFSYGGFMRYNYQGGNPGTVSFDDETTFFNSFGTADDSVNFWEYRWRQFFNLKVNDHVTTNVKFEVNSQFGRERMLGGASGDLQVPSEAEFRIKNAFVRFDLPGTPVSVTVGQQDFSTPKALINVEDSTGVKLEFAAAGGTHTLFWARPLEGGDFQAGSDDADWFGFVPTFKTGDVTISGHLSYVKIGAAAVDPVNADGSSDVLFFGVDTEGKIGAIGFTADLVFQRGTTNLVPAAGGDLDIFSYILDVSASLAAGPGTLTIKGLYSPGDDNAADNDLDAWQQVLATDMGWSPFFHDGSDNSDFAGNLLPGVEDAGVMAVGVEFALSPAKDVTVVPNAYYLLAAEDKVAPGLPSNGEDEYGIEFGVQANWKIWDAVTILGQFDYLVAGDFFKPDTGGSAKDAWRVIVGPRISW